MIKDEGFILLTSVWLLVLGGAIAAAVMLNARSAVRSVKAAEQQTVANDALVSARDQVIADLISAGRFSRWAQSASAGNLNTDGNISVEMQVSQEGGRLDVLSSQSDTLDSLFASLDIPAALRNTARASLDDVRVAAQSGKRPLQSLRQLQALRGWTPQLTACLVPLITIHSAMPTPSPSAAPAELARLLNLQRLQDDGGAVDTQSVAGELYRLQAIVRMPQGVARTAWMLRITGDLRAPYWVLGSYTGGLPDTSPQNCFKLKSAL